MGKTVNFSQTNLIPLMRVLKENVELDTYTIGGEPDAPVGGRYYHVSDEEVNEEETLVTESKNSDRAHRQTRQIIAQYMGTDENDPGVTKAEQEFEARMFGEGKRVDWFVILEPLLYNWYLQSEDISKVQSYTTYIFLHATSLTKESIIIQEYLQSHNIEKKKDLTPEQQAELAALVKPERQKLLDFINQIKQFSDFNAAKQFLDQQKKADDEASREEQANMGDTKNPNYIVSALTYDEAHDIGTHSYPNGKICYTQDEETWDEYTNYDRRKCYVLLRNGWENISPEHDGSESNNGLPEPLNQFNGYDNYGLSMIFVIIDKFGNLTTSNTRWNHNAKYAPGHGVDNALTELDIAKLMGTPFEQVFGVKKEDVTSYVKEKLNNPDIYIDDIFDESYDEFGGVESVNLGRKYNYVVYEKRTLYGYEYKYRYLLWDKPFEEWFDWNYDFNPKIGYGVVVLNGKSFFIDKNANLHDVIKVVKEKLSIGYDVSEIFTSVKSNGSIAVITLDNRKYNYINLKTKEFLWDKPYDEWFNWAIPFNTFGVYTYVRVNNKRFCLDEHGNTYEIEDIIKKRIKGEPLESIFYWVESTNNYIKRVQLINKSNYVNTRTKKLLWDKPFEKWFDGSREFENSDYTHVFLGNNWYKFTKDGELFDLNDNLVSEDKIYNGEVIAENFESEVESSEVDLSSFKKKDKLVPSLWKDEDTLNSKARLKLLDIADDFWKFVNITWVEPKGIILTGSICNFNWSEFSDIDLHLIVDFDEIDDRVDFVRDYMDSKKNEWNNEHDNLKIMGFPVELYVQNVDEMPESGGIYDLEENSWVRKPKKDDIKPIGLNKYSIKDKAAEIMTIIDDMNDALDNTNDGHEIEEIGEDASYLWKKIKNLRKKSLEINGESGPGNIVYKILRRTGYLNRLWKMRTKVYDRSNSIFESKNSVKKYLTLLKEEVVADGNSEHNPFDKRWKAERKALKDFLVNSGKIMTSKENGKQYKVYYDETLSNLIGYNYCICIQWNPTEMKPESTIYVRALDKFTNRIFQAQYDDRGRDNMRGTYDDMGYSQRFESRNSHKALITEANNKKRAKNQTIGILAQGLGMDVDDPQLLSLESDFRNVYFNHIGNKEIDRVIMYEPLFAKCALDLGFGTDNYNDDDFVNYVNYLILKTKDSQNYSEIIGYYKSKISSYDDMVNIVGDEIKAKRDSEKKKMASMEVNVNQNYEVRGPLSFEEAHVIGMGSCPSSIICYTKYEDTWLSSSYSNKNRNKCYVLLRNDWEDYNDPEMAVHDGSERDNWLPSPLNEYNGYDNYGLSMIFVWVDQYGNLYKSNTRWNHNAKYAPGHGIDTAMTETDIAMLMGEPFEQVFNVEKVDKLEKIKERLSNGELPEDIFDSCVSCDYFNLIVTIGEKYNVLREDNTLVWDKPIEEWFDYCSSSYYGGGCILVSIKEKCNFLKSDGTLVWKNDEWPDTSNWFDWADEFREGVVYVKMGISVNYLRLDGTLVWKNDDFPDTSYWFSEMSEHFFKNGKVAVKLGLYWYNLKLDGKLYDYNDKVVLESKTSPKLLTESNNSKAARNKTKRLIAQLNNLDVNDPKVDETERMFENEFFGAENYSADWFIVLEPNAYSWAYGNDGDKQDAKRCLDYAKKIGDNIFPEKQINTQYCAEHGINYDGTVSLKELLSPEQFEELNNIKTPYREKRNVFITQVRQINDLFDVESFVCPTIEQMNKENRRIAKERKANGEEIKVNHNLNYDIVGPLTREQSKVYGDRSAEDGSSCKICYTQYPDTWGGPRYSDNNQNNLFILLSKDWESIKPVHDGSEKDNVLGAPYNKLSGYDRYGMSMIFLWVNPGGVLHSSNTRWNHSGSFRTGDVDQAFTQDAIEKLMGCSLSEITKMDSVDDKVDELEERLKNGEDIRSVFGNVEQYGDVFLVRVSNKYNLVKKDGTFVWNRPYSEWFVGLDLCDFTVDNKHMFFTLSYGDGKFVLGDIYGNIYNYKSFIRRFNELAQTCNIKFDHNYNYVNGNANFKRVYFSYVKNYLGKTSKVNVYNFKEKKFVFDEFFDNIDSLSYIDDSGELIVVSKNGFKNVAKLNGEFIYKAPVNRWFSDIFFSKNSNKNLMTVEYYNDGNYSYNLMDWNGNILLKENAPYISEFMNCVCIVENDKGEEFFMTEDLQPLDDKMFDSIDTEEFISESDAYVTCNLAGSKKPLYFSKISHNYLTLMDIENAIIEYISEGSGYNMMVDIVNEYGDYSISDIIENFEKDCLGIDGECGYYDSNVEIQDKLENFIDYQAQSDYGFWLEEYDEDD